MSAKSDYYFLKPDPPSLGAWFKHFAFLFITFCTMTIAGVLYPFGLIYTLPDGDPQSWPEVVQFLITLPPRYLLLVFDAVDKLLGSAEYLTYGLSFSVSLVFILLAHEMGHYIACRIYRVDATLPFFIPTPPMIGPAGTFGAFIKIKSPMPSKKAVFDIGVAGPIAGFLALIPVALIGISAGQTAAGVPAGGLVFAQPLLIRLFALIFNTDPDAAGGNPFYYAAWVGLLVTALNLIPSGQLDGGHAIYAILGKTVHRWTGRIAFVVMAVLSVVGFLYFNSPSGFLVAILLAVMLRVKHPQPYDEEPLDKKRKAVAFLVFIIFCLSFTPFPVKIL